MDKSKASHLAVPEHLKSTIYAEKADGFHKRVKKIHDLVKLMIPCTLSEDEFPILPDRSVHLGSFIEVFYDHLHAIAPKTCLRYKYDVDRGPSVAVSNDTTSVSQHPWRIRAQGVKYRVRSRGFSQSFAKVQALFIVEMIDKGEDSMKAFHEQCDEDEENKH
ncbi:BnaC06g07390D [Brassica napus]|uniref:BnaC06g07390D protein n=1 Tax=Brassica napus TaxID=3708 RepID=A0A078JAY9_BRANA|nr:BnaC06g07390D [Brassica napus]